MAGKKILFILFEGLPGFVIDSQVLIHVQMVQEKMGIRAEIWTFACNEKLYQSSLKQIAKAENISQSKVKVMKGVRPVFPWSFKANGEKVRKMLRGREGEFALIHARTDYTAAVVSRISAKLKIPYVWDCRGDSSAEFLAIHNSGYLWKQALVKWRMSSLNNDRKQAAKNCTGAIFVSNPLKEMNLSAVRGKTTLVIPCSASRKLFYVSDNLRKRIRAKLGYSSNNMVYIYSGSMNSYQCFPETIAHFEQVLGKDPNARLLVLTLADKHAENVLQNISKNVRQIKSASLDEMNGYLNAADVAYMLRENCQLNAVASPTKFAEYALTGLPVIMTEVVIDTVRYAKNIGNYYSANKGLGLMDRADRQKISDLAVEVLSREQVMEKYENLYRSVGDF